MGHHETALLLLNVGARINAADADGWTPMMAAVARQDTKMVKLLRKRGAGMTVAAAVLLKDEREMRRLVEKAAKDRRQIPDASMALLIATRNGGEEMVKYLVDKCPDIDIKESCCDTALLFAIENKRSRIAEILLNKGADPTLRTIGTRPLSIMRFGAAISGWSECLSKRAPTSTPIP